MKKYIKVAWHLFINGLMSQLEYRAERLGWSIISVLSMWLLFFWVEVIFNQTTSIAGWNKKEVLLVVITQGIITSLLWTIFLPSVMTFTRHIRKGTFDFLLMKPLSSRFLVSFNTGNMDDVPRFMLCAWLLVRAFSSTGLATSAVVGYVVMLILGLLIMYNFFFLITTLTLWFTDFFNIYDLFLGITNLGKYPLFIYGENLKLFFTLFVPTAFIATFPVQVLVGRFGVEMIILAIVILIVSSVLSQKFWAFALKHYSSASS